MSALKHVKTFAFATLALPLALGLAACGGGKDDESALAGEPVAAVPAPEGQTWTETATITDRNGYLVGNPDAPIKLLEFGSLTCPACAAFSVDGSEQLLSEYVDSGRVSYEFRSFAIHGPIDLALTSLIDCGSPEQAIPLADQIWANLPTLLQPVQQNAQQLDAALQLPEDQRFVAFAETAGLLDFFAARGISRDQARTCLANAKRLGELAEFSESYGTQDDIRSTPTFLINGSTIDGTSWQAVEAALQRAGAR